MEEIFWKNKSCFADASQFLKQEWVCNDSVIHFLHIFTERFLKRSIVPMMFLQAYIGWFIDVIFEFWENSDNIGADSFPMC